MFTVTEVPIKDGGPYTVTPYGGQGVKKKVNRAELQLCPMKSDPLQSIRPIASERAPNQTIHEDTPSDTESEFMLLLKRGEMLGLRVCKFIANPVTNSKFATICHICTRANS